MHTIAVIVVVFARLSRTRDEVYSEEPGALHVARIDPGRS